jgi:uncharacterized protein (DUF885 family)
MKIEPVPAFSEASVAGGYYYPPAEDGSRPGTCFISLYKAETQPRAGMESTAFHIRAFHDRVLGDGAVPLVLLREKVERLVEGEGKPVR